LSDENQPAAAADSSPGNSTLRMGKNVEEEDSNRSLAGREKEAEGWFEDKRR